MLYSNLFEMQSTAPTATCAAEEEGTTPCTRQRVSSWAKYITIKFVPNSAKKKQHHRMEHPQGRTKRDSPFFTDIKIHYTSDQGDEALSWLPGEKNRFIGFNRFKLPLLVRTSTA